MGKEDAAGQVGAKSAGKRMRTAKNIGSRRQSVAERKERAARYMERTREELEKQINSLAWADEPGVIAGPKIMVR